MSNPSKPNIQKTTVEYENLDLPPVYVESVQGMISPSGMLHVSFFTDSIKGRNIITSDAEVQEEEEGVVGVIFKTLEPFGLDGDEVCIRRRVEANMILNTDAVARLIPWLQAKLAEMQAHEKRTRKRTKK